MTEFKVADAKNFCRGAVERSGAPVSELLGAATLRCKRSLRELEAKLGVSEVIHEQQEALPPWLGGIKKEKRKGGERRKYSPSLRQTRGRCVIREQRRLKRDKYKGESSRRVQVIPALRSKRLR